MIIPKAVDKDESNVLSKGESNQWSEKIGPMMTPGGPNLSDFERS